MRVSSRSGILSSQGGAHKKRDATSTGKGMTAIDEAVCTLGRQALDVQDDGWVLLAEAL